jgi:hypothetical protein
VFDSRWTCDGKNSPKFEHVVSVMHGSSMWVLGEEDGLFEDLIGRSSGRRSDECGQVVRSGRGSDLEAPVRTSSCVREI